MTTNNGYFMGYGDSEGADIQWFYYQNPDENPFRNTLSNELGDEGIRLTWDQMKSLYETLGELLNQ